MSEAPVADMPAVTRLRSAFDEIFAVPSGGGDDREPAIQIRVSNEILVIRTGQIAGLWKPRKIVPVPSRVPELLGVAALRGSLIPVYDLAALLGIPRGAGSPSWMVVVPGEPSIGLAFDGFEGQQVARMAQ